MNRVQGPNVNDEAREAAKTLTRHSFWTGSAFCAIILIAAGIEWFSKLLVISGIIESGDLLDWVCRIGSYFLVIADLAMLIAVIGKQGIRLVKAS